MSKPCKKPFQIDKARTWLKRPGQMASTDLEGVTRRYIVHRWSDTGETTMKDIVGDAWQDPENAALFSEWNLGVTASIGDAVAAADVMRNDPDRLLKRLAGVAGRRIVHPPVPETEVVEPSTETRVELIPIEFDAAGRLTPRES